MRFKERLKQHKIIVLLAILIIAIPFTWNFIKSFSEDIDSSAWDGVVANAFTSGTGTIENPYIISSAAEYAHLKELLEGESAAFYANKNYLVVNPINYGEYDIAINNIVPFSGTIDGNYNYIYNATVTNSLLKLASGATIKNINFDEITVTATNNTGIIVNEMEEVNILAVSLYGTVLKGENIEEVTVSGVAATDSESTIKDVVINVSSEDANIISLIEEPDKTTFTNVLVDKAYDKIGEEAEVDLSGVYDIDFSEGTVTIPGKVISEIDNDEYKIVVKNNKVIFEDNTVIPEENKGEEENPSPAKGPNRSPDITVHASGIDTTNKIIYINDLASDYNYYMGRNYTEITNTTGTIPDGTNQTLYDNTNLATVYIRYSAADINNSSVTGSVSVSETVNNYYYFKRYPVVNNTVTFDLIDNPWANRPSGKAFNGWVTDYTGAVVSLDIDTYVRKVTIPVSNVSTPISITFYTSWTVASLAEATGDISSNFHSISMQELTGRYESVTSYHYKDHIARYSYYPDSGAIYNMSGTRLTNGGYCNTSGGCDFVRPNGNAAYVSGREYYSVTPNGNNATLTRVYPGKISSVEYYDATADAGGLFVRVTSGSTNIYNSSGEKISTCGSSCYKLLQYGEQTVGTTDTYYYLATRDTNIFAPSSTSEITTGNISTTYPMTITGINNGADNSTRRTIRLSANWSISNDLRIEFITFYVENTTTTVTEFQSGTGYYKIIGRFHNLKIGRGIKRYNSNLTATAYVGGNSSAQTSVAKYSMIIESGFYQNGAAVGFTTSTTASEHRVNAYITLGNDYDRIAGNNNNLIVYYCHSGTWASNLYNSSSSSNTYDFPAIYTVVKSGSFGSNKGDYAAGIYTGGRGRGSSYALREIVVEGGYIYNLIGGPGSDSGRAGKNDIIMNVKGGEIDLIIGGAGVSDTVGSRILNVTGGTINYSVLGGSNAYSTGSNSSNPYGKIDGDTLVYVGGSATIGTKSDKLFTVESGSVFGAGNGRAGELDVGSVNNSTVIIDNSATINGSVYGGGNNGAVGGNTTGVSTGGSGGQTGDSGVYEDGTTDNNIRYYGSNPNNYIMFNNERYRIVGLFNNVSTTNGNKSLIRIMKVSSAASRAWISRYESPGGNARNYENYFNNQSYASMRDYLNSTYYSGLNSTYQNYIQAVNWTTGAIANNNNTAASFYAAEHGSTTSSPNATTSYNANIGLFYASDFGFANNSSTCLGYNLSNYGNYSTCYNNNWISSSISAETWTMSPSTYYANIYNNNSRTYNAYYMFTLGTGHNISRNAVAYRSGGNYNYRSYATYPSFYLKEDVTISSGDGSYNTPYVIGSSDDLLTDIVYELMHPSVLPPDPGNEITLHEESDYLAKTHIRILGGTIQKSVYGGGNSNGAGNANNNRLALAKITIDIEDCDINGSVYGGSNEFGRVYGDVFVNVSNGDIAGSVYGGGKGGYEQGVTDGTYVSDNVFVNIGDANTTSLDIHGSVYGGSAFGTVNSATEGATESEYGVVVTVKDGLIRQSVFGGGQGDTTHTPKVVGSIEVNIEGGDITNVFGGNDQAGTHTKSNHVNLTGGIVDNAYGGGNKSSVTTTHVKLDGADVGNIYGGSNTSGAVTTANVSIESGSVDIVYGGNNVGGSCTTTIVTVDGTATVTTAVYGGGNAVDTTTTNVNLNSAGATIPSVYGGGYGASVGTANITEDGVSVTTMFGGSNTTGTVTDSVINYESGTTGTVYGGNNAGGNALTSTINLNGGSATTVYGGGNRASGSESNITLDGSSVGTIFGGGDSAGVTDTHIEITSGSVTTIYGGSNTTGTCTTTDIVVDGVTGTISNIYGGGNLATVGSTSVEINAGTIGNIFGGGKSAQATGNTVVDINGGTINTNVYGGGDDGVVKGNSTVTITDATILGSAYAGGNGLSATLEGNTFIMVDGSSVIGSSTSVPPASGCVFGGGNRAYTGTSNNNHSTTSVNVVGGTIYGNVYGGANTSVVYGSTEVNIGKSSISSNYDDDDIHIYGHIFGGGEANASGSVIYDWSFISVTQGAVITIDADDYDDFEIDGSFYGGGNASTASGDSYLYIKNYGEFDNPERNISIQRVTYVIIDNSSILLAGAIDKANDYDNELFAVSRVVNLKLKNNSEIYFVTGANLLEEFESLDSSGNPASVTIDTEHNTVTKTVDNRVYMFEGRNLNIAKDEQVSDYGEVTGMSFFGIFNFDNDNNVNTGIYSSTYAAGDTLPWNGTFTRGSYVLGKHMTDHNIQVNGFYSNFMNEETAINEVDYIVPTPPVGQGYMWYIGENVIEYNVNLTASKYSTLGAVETPFLEFSDPNTSFDVLTFDSSEIATGISLIDKNDIPRIAATTNDANNIFGLAMEASNSGWLTTGKTSFYTHEPSISGVTHYEGENSNAVPTMLFYLYHSKNITESKDLGTVRIAIMAITKLSALSSRIERMVINVNMSTALFQTNEYEGAMTPGDKYELFTSTANNITTKSKLSAYYALYGAGTNLYRTGYHRVLTSSWVLPLGTKITMLDFLQGSPEYYYHVIDSNDVTAAQAEFQQENECSYPLTLFTRMGSKSNNSNYDDATKNAIYYDGDSSSEEFIFIVDFSDTTIGSTQLDNTLLIEIRDSNEESIISVLGIQHSKLTYNLYYGLDGQIAMDVTPEDDPLYIGYSDVFDVLINYQASNLSGNTIIDTQYFDSKMGIQIYIENNEGNVVSGTDLTGTYFMMDEQIYYPDIEGYTHIKLTDKVGNTEKWIIFNTENSNLATGDYTFKFEAFASPDGIYYSSGDTDTDDVDLTIINSTYGLDPTIADDSVIYSAVNNKRFTFSIRYTSLLDNPNIRIAMYRREYDTVYDTDYVLVDFKDFADQTLTATGNVNSYEYMVMDDPPATFSLTYNVHETLLTGTYRLSFRLYDDDTMIGEIIRYIIVK